MIVLIVRYLIIIRARTGELEQSRAASARMKWAMPVAVRQQAACRDGTSARQRPVCGASERWSAPEFMIGVARTRSLESATPPSLKCSS
jgi:hypothetical protein